MRIPHDELFKELLSTFLEEFVQLFLPEIAAQIEPGSLELQDKELYPWLKWERGRRADLLVKARIRGREAFLLILIEHESGSRSAFPRRFFGYVARFLENTGLDVLPIVVYSYARPLCPGRNSFKLDVLGKQILLLTSTRFSLISLIGAIF